MSTPSINSHRHFSLQTHGQQGNDLAPITVGTYLLLDDSGTFIDRTSAKLVNSFATKYRIDSSASVHCFSINHEGKEYRLPGISTGNFFLDFSEPTQQELGLVKTLLEGLEQCGIQAFSCNWTHHAIVLYSHTRNQESTPELMTPEAFASFLQDDPRIFSCIQDATTQNMKDWQQAFVGTFGKKS